MFARGCTKVSHPFYLAMTLICRMTEEESIKCVDLTVNRLFTLPPAIFGESPNNVIYFAITVLLKKLAGVGFYFGFLL
jgi:hypothetical protein